jgi:hypothetical protein
VPIRVGVSDGTISEVAEGAVRAGEAVITDTTDARPSQVPPAFRRGF